MAWFNIFNDYVEVKQIHLQTKKHHVDVITIIFLVSPASV